LNTNGISENTFRSCLVSRVEDLVDKTDDPKSLFWKIDFIHKHLPKWLMPDFERQKMHLKKLVDGGND